MIFNVLYLVALLPERGKHHVGARFVTRELHWAQSPNIVLLFYTVSSLLYSNLSTGPWFYQIPTHTPSSPRCVRLLVQFPHCRLLTDGCLCRHVLLVFLTSSWSLCCSDRILNLIIQPPHFRASMGFCTKQIMP